MRKINLLHSAAGHSQIAVLCLLILLMPVSAIAQTRNEPPLFGELEKTPKEKLVDEQFIKNATQAAGSRKRAVESFLAKGWSAMAQANSTEAIKRFNQAYLLDPKDYRTYWGLAAATGQQGNFVESLKLFEQSEKLSKRPDSRLICDHGYSLMTYGAALANNKQTASSPNPAKFLSLAEEKFNRALELSPQDPLPYSRLAILSFYQGNYSAAWQRVKNAESVAAKGKGGAVEKGIVDGLDPRFLADLSAKMKRPATS